MGWRRAPKQKEDIVGSDGADLPLHPAHMEVPIFERATSCRRQPGGENHRSDTSMSVLVPFPPSLLGHSGEETPFMEDKRCVEKGALVGPGGGNYISAPLREQGATWDQGAKWKQGKQTRQPVDFPNRLVSTTINRGP